LQQDAAKPGKLKIPVGIGWLEAIQSLRHSPVDQPVPQVSERVSTPTAETEKPHPNPSKIPTPPPIPPRRFSSSDLASLKTAEQSDSDDLFKTPARKQHPSYYESLPVIRSAVQGSQHSNSGNRDSSDDEREKPNLLNFPQTPLPAQDVEPSESLVNSTLDALDLDGVVRPSILASDIVKQLSALRRVTKALESPMAPVVTTTPVQPEDTGDWGSPHIKIPDEYVEPADIKEIQRRASSWFTPKRQ
jgi:hypothetical protein